ncbi:unnamed protein product, partial [Hymenolepis diminuta]
ITLYTFPELPFIRSLHDNTSAFRPRSWSDLIYVPMTHDPYLPCLRVHRFLPFSITASLRIKSTSALMLSQTHIKLSFFSTQKQRTLVSHGLQHVPFISPLPKDHNCC